MGGALGLIGRGCPTTWVTLMKTVGTYSRQRHIITHDFSLLTASR